MVISTQTPGTVSITEQNGITNIVSQGQGSVTIQGDADSVRTADFVGNDLVIGLKNGETFSIEGYRLNENIIEVFFEDSSGVISVLEDVRGGGLDPILLDLVEVGGGGLVGGLGGGALGVIGALGLAGAVVAGGGGGSDGAAGTPGAAGADGNDGADGTNRH